MKNSEKTTFKEKFSKIIHSPITLVLSMVFGFIAAKYLPGIQPFTKLFSTIYMGLLQMCVLPLVFGAVAVNISSLVKKEFRSVLAKVVIASVMMLLISSVIGTLFGVALSPILKPTPEVTESIAKLQEGGGDKLVPDFIEVSYYNSVDEAASDVISFAPSDFLLNIVPSNVFEAFTNGDILKVIFFSAVVGIMLSLIDPGLSTPIMKGLEAVYQLFCIFINTLLTILPLGMFCIIANQFSMEGMDQILRPLLRLVAVIYLGCIIMIILVFITIQIRTRCSVSTHLKAIQRTFFLAISTSSCIATLSVVTEDIIKHFKLKENLVKSVMPIMITTIQSGIIIATTIIVVFASLLYEIPLTAQAILIIIIGSIFYAFSIIGVPGIVAATMISIVVEPMGIPSGIVSVILMAIVMFFDPIAVFASVYGNVGISTYIIPKEDEVYSVKEQTNEN